MRKCEEEDLDKICVEVANKVSDVRIAKNIPKCVLKTMYSISGATLKISKNLEVEPAIIFIEVCL